MILVLKLIAESNGNDTELFADTIMAVSQLVVGMPRITDQAGDLLAVFDTIDLGHLRREAKQMRLPIPTSSVIASLLAARFHEPITAEISQWLK